MANIHSFKYLKYSLIILILYNIISLLVLFLPFKSLKYSLWNMMPYDYKYLVNYPNDLKNLSLLNSTNRDFIKEGLNKNSSRNILDINYWNYNLIIDSYSKEKNKDFEKSFINLFFLTIIKLFFCFFFWWRRSFLFLLNFIWIIKINCHASNIIS